MSPARTPGMSLIKLFLARNISTSGGITLPSQESNPEIPEVLPTEEFCLWHPGFLAGDGDHSLDFNTSALEEFFPDQERKIPGNPVIPEVFPARKSLISDIPWFLAGDEDYTHKLFKQRSDISYDTEIKNVFINIINLEKN